MDSNQGGVSISSLGNTPSSPSSFTVSASETSLSHSGVSTVCAVSSSVASSEVGCSSEMDSNQGGASISSLGSLKNSPNPVSWGTPWLVLICNSAKSSGFAYSRSHSGKGNMGFVLSIGNDCSSGLAVKISTSESCKLSLPVLVSISSMIP